MQATQNCREKSFLTDLLLQQLSKHSAGDMYALKNPDTNKWIVLEVPSHPIHTKPAMTYELCDLWLVWCEKFFVTLNSQKTNPAIDLLYPNRLATNF